jgi:hypothetical protein
MGTLVLRKPFSAKSHLHFTPCSFAYSNVLPSIVRETFPLIAAVGQALMHAYPHESGRHSFGPWYIAEA